MKLNILEFDIKKSKPTKTIVIEKQDFSKTKNSFYVTALGEIDSIEPIKRENIEHDSRLTYNTLNKTYILSVPRPRIIKNNNSEYNICGIDPGNKTFMTVYNPEGKCLKIFNRDNNKRLSLLLKRKLKLLKLNKEHKIVKYKKSMLKNNKKIINLVKELHYKTALYLCSKFDIIYLGNLSTKGITSKTKNMTNFEKLYTYAISHDKFRTILKNKAEELNKTINVVNESYTIMTCGSCGELKTDVGRNRIYSCSNCLIKMDRDLNGARNILIKHN